MGASRDHVELGLQLWNDGDLEKLQSLWDPDGVDETPLGAFTGPDAIGDQYRRNLSAFPDRRFTALTWAEDGDIVVVEGEFSGTHSGPVALPDGSQLPATGQRLQFRMVSVYEVRDGKLVAHRAYWDTLPGMIQVGAVAPSQQQ